MCSYFIKCEDIAIHAIESIKIGGGFTYKIIDLDAEVFGQKQTIEKTWLLLCSVYPYANCCKTELWFQLTNKHKRRSVKKKVIDHIVEIPQVKSILRSIKINLLIN